MFKITLNGCDVKMKWNNAKNWKHWDSVYLCQGSIAIWIRDPECH